MGLLGKLVLLSLLVNFTTCLSTRSLGKPVWYKDLKAKCVGAKDEYYVDDNERKCCKCSNCTSFRSHRRPDCSPDRNCDAYYGDCIYEENFHKVFSVHPAIDKPPPPSTPPKTRTPMTLPVVHKPPTSSLTETDEMIPTGENLISNPSSGDTSLVLVGATAAFAVALLFAIALLLRSKCRKTGSSSLMKLIHLCKREKPSSSNTIQKLETKTREGSSREETVQLVSEYSTGENEAPPPPTSPASEFGPPGMLLNEHHGINPSNEISGGRSFGDSSTGTNISYANSDGFSNSNMVGIAGRHAQQTGRHLDCQSNNTGTVVSGNSNVIFGVNNGPGNITFHQPQITIMVPREVNGTAPQTSVANARQLEMLNDNSQISGQSYRTIPYTPSSMGDVRSNPCFPTGKSGQCVTSASPLLSKDKEANHLFRRQSSEMSSTSSNGPVENGPGETSRPKEFSCQESEGSRSQSHSSDSIASRLISSRMNGPVQHSSSRESIRQISSNGHRYSEEDSMMTRAPQSDLESS